MKEYPVVNQLILVGEKSNKFKDQIRKIMKLKEKRSFIKSFLASDIEKIKDLYASLGYNFSNVEVKVNELDNENIDLVVSIERGNKTKIKTINFIGNEAIKSKRLREIIASEEDKFWKIISRNTNLNENQIELDVRLIKNYYRSNGYYNIEVNSKTAKINENGDAEVTYAIKEGNRFIIKKISTNLDPVFDKKFFL